ncbi:unnamed protein product [Effrenium voratum]|nr:unnamed protein product [Effrenium voratum]
MPHLLQRVHGAKLWKKTAKATKKTKATKATDQSHKLHPLCPPLSASVCLWFPSSDRLVILASRNLPVCEAIQRRDPQLPAFLADARLCGCDEALLMQASVGQAESARALSPAASAGTLM